MKLLRGYIFCSAIKFVFMKTPYQRRKLAIFHDMILFLKPAREFRLQKWRRHFRCGSFAKHNDLLAEGVRLGQGQPSPVLTNRLPPAWLRCNLYGIIFKFFFGVAMHTDEYEISIAREISLCRKIIGRLKINLAAMEKRYGIATEEFLRSPEIYERGGGRGQDFERWRDDHEELRERVRMLRNYEEAAIMLQMV